MNRYFLVLSGVVLLTTFTLSGQTVRFETSVGNINVQLMPADAPKTVANFLQYLNSGAFNGSFIHRWLKELDPGFQTRNLVMFEVEPTLSGYKPQWARDY